uniref:Uncharacterized protein n=1 Tax=Ornithorhynchus anatinus TaxID=9258 RepID=A0A6I8NY86_ORNAN
MASSLLRLFIWRWPQTFHFHVAHVYAHLGYPSAQHIVGQRYLKGAGVEKNEEMAMRWFGQASRRGHPHASFHPAVGKLKNGTVALEEGYLICKMGIKSVSPTWDNLIPLCLPQRLEQCSAHSKRITNTNIIILQMRYLRPGEVK